MQLTYPFPDPPPLATTLEVAGGVRWLRMPLPFALNHINLWLIADGDQWSAVDAGLATTATKDAWSDLLPSFRLNRLIVTHFHPDHLGLATWLEEETGAPLLISQSEYQCALLVHTQAPGYSVAATLELFRRHGLDEAKLQSIEVRGNAYRLGVPEIPRSFSRLRDGMAINIGGNDWRVIAGFGHSPEHCSLYAESIGVLISGDMLLPRISTNVPVAAVMPDGDPLADFLDSIEKLRELPADTLVLPAHGTPFRGIAARVNALQAHHRERCENLLRACATPRTAAELVPVLFDRAIDDAHQCFFAMGEAIAHLNYLEHRRRVGRSEENGIIRFVTH